MITRRNLLKGMAAGLAGASVAALTLIRDKRDSLWSKAFYPDTPNVLESADHNLSTCHWITLMAAPTDVVCSTVASVSHVPSLRAASTTLTQWMTLSTGGNTGRVASICTLLTMPSRLAPARMAGDISHDPFA